ncbi:PKD domain-containing protein [Actinoplanes sp. NPDC051494]|uniref:PKD domain-containing protein n=1 Tax=Actinoplanes sp. NPDC051494 TaxID=3363907 RepID=UPI00379C21F3
MNVRRLKRPLLAVAVSGALLAGGALAPTAAFATDSGRESVADASVLLDDEPSPTPTTTPPPVTPEPSAPTSPEASDPASPEPSDPTSPEPSDPASPEPSDPTSPEPSDSTSPEPSTPASPEPSTTTPAPAPDKTAPTGTFALNTGSLWVGQRVTFTQKTVTDNVSSAANIARVVNWGDGSSSTLKPGQAINKQYTRNGKFTITFTVKDKAGNTAKKTAAVTVTTPAKVKFSRSSAWLGQRITATFSGVPAGTTRIRFDMGDGYVEEIKPRNQSYNFIYYHRLNGGLVKGATVLRATYYNKYGASSAIFLGKIQVKADSWKPVVKVNKPKNANRISSWKTVSGTVTDKGSGVPVVYVWVSRIAGSKVYCYTPQKKWKQVYTEAQYNNCEPVAVKPSKGKWSVKVNGLKKSTIYVDALAFDWADKQSKWASVKSKLTRS